MKAINKYFVSYVGRDEKGKEGTGNMFLATRKKIKSHRDICAIQEEIKDELNKLNKYDVIQSVIVINFVLV